MVANIVMAQGFAKFFINMAYSSIYVYSSELFPTVVRYYNSFTFYILKKLINVRFTKTDLLRLTSV